MKGLSETIIIVITAVVILVAALVLLTIFSGGVGNVGTMTNAESQCRTQCAVTCKMGSLPPTWDIMLNVGGGQQKSCRQLVGDCSACGGTPTTTTTSGTAGCGSPPTCASGCHICYGTTEGSTFCCK